MSSRAGNQQKVALARLLHQKADVILLDEPTRGIDVGSKAEIYRLIGELAAQGAAVVMVSSYLPELFGVCDRLAVMCRGVLSRAQAGLGVGPARGDGGGDGVVTVVPASTRGATVEESSRGCVTQTTRAPACGFASARSAGPGRSSGRSSA